MFKVFDKSGPGTQYIVYDIKNENGETKFLIYRNNIWEWVDSHQFIPVRTID